MDSYSQFPDQDNPENVCVCEVDGRLCSAPKDFTDLSRFTSTVSRHPQITITRDMLHGAANRDETNRNVFLPVHEPVLKKIVHIWYEQGFLEALHFTADPENFNSEQTILTKTSQYLLNIVDSISRFSFYIRPCRYESDSIASVSTTNDWENSSIRCIAWHPQLTKIAVASLDDTVRIYGDSNLVPILKLRRQRGITCMAWRPNSNCELIVACDQVIILWTVDPNSVVTRPSSNSAHIMYVNGHSPIVSLAWSPFGDLLATAAAHDVSIRIWDVDTNRSESIKRSAGGGKSLVIWSPDGSKLFSASLGIIFRMWNCSNWSAERWDVGEGRVQSATFSPCGTILLFATTTEPTIFALRSNSEGIWANKTENQTQLAMPVLNLSRCDERSRFGNGLVRDISWSPKGTHLAVLFKESRFVAVFITITLPVLKITPCCIVNGLEYETPSCIAFQTNFEFGSCLTIGWSSGRIQYFPLVTTGNVISRNAFGDQLENSIGNGSFRPLV